MEKKVDFAFETTLAAKNYVQLIKTAKTLGYEVTLLYFWLNSPELAKQRVASRVRKGGHNIPVQIIERRYYRGIHNLFILYIPVCDNWLIIDNMGVVPDMVAYKVATEETALLPERVLIGLRKALRKLVESSAANNESLVIADKAGNIRTVPAEELLPLVENY